MLTVIARFTIQEGKMDDAFKTLKELMSKVALEEGTALYSLNRDRNQPNTLTIVEQYRDKGAFDYHASTPYFKDFLKVSREFVGGKPEITVLEEVSRI